MFILSSVASSSRSVHDTGRCVSAPRHQAWSTATEYRKTTVLAQRHTSSFARAGDLFYHIASSTAHSGSCKNAGTTSFATRATRAPLRTKSFCECPCARLLPKSHRHVTLGFRQQLATRGPLQRPSHHDGRKENRTTRLMTARRSRHANPSSIRWCSWLESAFLPPEGSHTSKTSLTRKTQRA